MRTIDGFPLTGEQNIIIDTALTGQSILVNARAGASKSVTSGYICKEFKGKILYTTFGNKNIRDFNSRFGNYTPFIKSNYGLAHTKIGSHYRNQGRLYDVFPIERIINLCNLKNIKINGFEFTKSNQAYDILKIITNFCYSTDEIITLDHMQSEFMDANEPLTVEYYRHLLPCAVIVWDEMVNRNSDFPITHDTYMKVWAAGLWNNGRKPKLNFDAIILDERQDSNPVFIDMIKNQDAQLIVVGDDLQQLYHWRGCIDAMNMLDIKTHLNLSKSFRFGQTVADLSSDIIYNHTGNDITINGFEKINTVVHTKPTKFDRYTVLCRTNGACVDHLVAAYFENKSVKFVGDISKIKKYIKGIVALRSRGKAYGSLSVFSTYKELYDYSQTSMGGEIKTLINVMNRCMKKDIDTNKLIDILDKSAKLRTADITVSTIHKAKGLEFDNVVLGDDLRGKENEAFEPQDTNLLYVAVTRAKKNLDISGCKTLMKMIGSETEPVI